MQSSQTPPLSPEELRKQRLLVVGATVGVLLLVAAIVAGVLALLANPEFTATLKDVILIAVALVLVLIGFTLVILAVQVARLVNMVQHEVRPVLDSANEAMNTLRGTAEFLSENLSEPVIRLSSYMAAFRRLLDTFEMLKKPFTK